MGDQPEALRLADAIDPLIRNRLDNLTCATAAAELRRLHAEVERLTKALRFIADHDLSGADLIVCGHIAHGLIGGARAASRTSDTNAPSAGHISQGPASCWPFAFEGSAHACTRMREQKQGCECNACACECVAKRRHDACTRTCENPSITCRCWRRWIERMA